MGLNSKLSIESILIDKHFQYNTYYMEGEVHTQDNFHTLRLLNMSLPTFKAS
jgi:hypothetical protein